MSVPLPLLATSARPWDEHALLRATGRQVRPEGEVVARPEEVAQALACPQLSVAPTSAAGAAERLRARMARFCDGPEHARRRATVEQLLPDAAGLAAAARVVALRALRQATEPYDAMPLARRVPVQTLAASLGLPAGDLQHVVELVGRLCDALAPRLPGDGAAAGGDDAADALEQLVAQALPGEQAVAAISLLFQARDATAGLIGNALVHGLDVERALREQAPVQCTTRRGPQAVVWVVLAAAEVGPPAEPATFGSGPHHCPGRGQARALAQGVLDALVGWRPVPGQPVVHEARPNLRIPQRVLVERA